MPDFDSSFDSWAHFLVRFCGLLPGGMGCVRDGMDCWGYGTGFQGGGKWKGAWLLTPKPVEGIMIDVFKILWDLAARRVDWWALGHRAGVTTVTVPTPIRPTPTCLCPSRVIWITPEHLIPNPNPLTPSRLSNALTNTPTPLHLVNAFPTRCTFNLSSPSRQVDSRHPHPFPTRRSFDLYSSSHQVNSRQPHSFPTRRLSTFTPLRQVYSRRSISLATAVGQSPITYLPRSMRLSLSFLALYISVRSSMSHHSLPFVCFLCLILNSPSPSTLVSSIFILTSVDPTLVIPYIPYDPFPIVQIIPILTTPRTCINTLSTSCCSSVW